MHFMACPIPKKSMLIPYRVEEPTQHVGTNNTDHREVQDHLDVGAKRQMNVVQWKDHQLGEEADDETDTDIGRGLDTRH
jgi:hypothetical protein